LEETLGKRAKRSLVNVVGYGLKYLFSTTDAKDVKRLVKACDELHVFETMTYASEHQLTYIRTLDEMTRQNAKDIVEVARAVRDSIRDVSIQAIRSEEGMADLRGAFEKHVQFSAAAREVEMAMLDMKFLPLACLSRIRNTTAGSS
jgi:hypothetical protein